MRQDLRDDGGIGVAREIGDPAKGARFRHEALAKLRE